MFSIFKRREEKIYRPLIDYRCIVIIKHYLQLAPRHFYFNLSLTLHFFVPITSQAIVEFRPPNRPATASNYISHLTGQMQAAFEDAAFKLNVNQLSGIVDSDSGLHIILRKA